jgi:hypothetical protein
MLDLLTAAYLGSQTIHIINVYQAGGGTWGEAEYQAALERYLTWLTATTGRVVLRGIQRSGQQRERSARQGGQDRTNTIVMQASSLTTARWTHR